MKYCLLIIMLFIGSVSADNDLIEKFIKDRITVQSEKIKPELVNKVFKGNFYKVKIIKDLGDGATSSSTSLVQITDGKVAYLQEATTNMVMTSLNKCINKKFKLNSDENIKTFEKVLDLLYPKSSFVKKDDIKTVKEPGKITFIRGKFFKKHKGFIIGTDKDGVITNIKYSLDIK